MLNFYDTEKKFRNLIDRIQSHNSLNFFDKHLSTPTLLQTVEFDDSVSPLEIMLHNFENSYILYELEFFRKNLPSSLSMNGFTEFLIYNRDIIIQDLDPIPLNPRGSNTTYLTKKHHAVTVPGFTPTTNYSSWTQADLPVISYIQGGGQRSRPNVFHRAIVNRNSSSLFSAPVMPNYVNLKMVMMPNFNILAIINYSQSVPTTTNYREPKEEIRYVNHFFKSFSNVEVYLRFSVAQGDLEVKVWGHER